MVLRIVFVVIKLWTCILLLYHYTLLLAVKLWKSINLLWDRFRVFLRQTWNCATWLSFHFTCLWLFFTSRKKNKRFHGIFIHENCFRLFLNAHFLFWEILYWSLPFAVNVTLRVCFFGMIRIWISDLRSLGSLWIKWTDEFLSRVDSLVHLIYHDPSDLRSLILIPIIPKQSTLNLYNSRGSHR